MSENSMRKFVETRLNTNMGITYPMWGVKIPNVKFDTPDQYVAHTILEGDSQQTTLGNVAQVRHVGVLQIDVYVQTDSGTGTLNEVVDFVGGLFTRLSANLEDQARVVFRTAKSRNMGSHDGYERKVVSIPWYRDEVKTSHQIG